METAVKAAQTHDYVYFLPVLISSCQKRLALWDLRGLT
jgi:hypothetical protein